MRKSLVAAFVGAGLIIGFQNCSGVKTIDPSGQSEGLSVVDPNTDPVVAKPTVWDGTPAFNQYVVISDLGIEKDDLDSETVVSSNTVFANKTLSSGKIYFEVRVDGIYGGSGSIGRRQRIGLGSTTGRLPNGPGSAATSVGYDFDGSLSSVGVAGAGYVNTPGGQAVKIGDIIGVAADLDAAIITFTLNGVIQAEADLEPKLSYSPMFFASNNSNGKVLANFGAKPFRYAPPDGFAGLDAVSVVSQAKLGFDNTLTPSQYVTLGTNGFSATKNSGAANVSGSAYGAISISAGRYYYEIRIDEVISGNRYRCGTAATVGRVQGGNTSDATFDYDANGSISAHVDGAFVNTPLAGARTLRVGDVCGIAIDKTANRIDFYVNGVRQGGRAISAGFNYAPHFHGNTVSNASATLNVGHRPFAYAPPVRYTPLIAVVADSF